MDGKRLNGTFGEYVSTVHLWSCKLPDSYRNSRVEVQFSDLRQRLRSTASQLVLTTNRKEDKRRPLLRAGFKREFCCGKCCSCAAKSKQGREWKATKNLIEAVCEDGRPFKECLRNSFCLKRFTTRSGTCKILCKDRGVSAKENGWAEVRGWFLGKRQQQIGCQWRR